MIRILYYCIIMVFATISFAESGNDAREPRKAVELKGTIINPNKEYGGQVDYRLVADAVVGWEIGSLTSDFDLNGYSLTMDTGNGNYTMFSGVVSGKGNLTWSGGGVPQVAASIIQGEAANTFQGTFTLERGVLDLDKPDGKDVIPGDLILGTKASAVILLKKNEQINDAARVTIGPEGVSGFNLNGKKECIGSFTLKGHACIDYSDKPSEFTAGNSSACVWDLSKVVKVLNFKKNDRFRIGTDDKGLTSSQLTRIGFANPEEMPKGLYSAQQDSSGNIKPGKRVTAVNPPFDVSDQAIAMREKVYAAYNGSLDRLTGKDTPVSKDMTILFFGDSLTWQDSFVGRIREGLQKGEGTRDKKIRVVNRGINGGGILQIRDGSKDSAFPGSSAQKPFAELLVSDKADMAVLLIGVNDVWWRDTKPEDFEAAMRDIVKASRDANVKLVLSTLTIQGELPNNMNPNDAKLDQYANITEKVAKDSGVTFVNARAAYKAYLLNNNAELRVDGSLYMKDSGIMTYDGVHPSSCGAELLTQLMSDGLIRALK